MKDKPQSQRQTLGPGAVWLQFATYPQLPFFRAGSLLRRSGPVPGILAAPRPGAIVDKSERPFRCSCSGTPKHPDQSPIFTQANNLKTCNLKRKSVTYVLTAPDSCLLSSVFCIPLLNSCNS